MIAVTYLISSLEIGGAERQLSALVRTLDPRDFTVTVLTQYPGGALESEVRDAGARVQCLGKQSAGGTLGFVSRLRHTLSDIRPDILHSYMMTSNLLALAARSAAPEAKLVWGIRQTNLRPFRYGLRRGLTTLIGERLEVLLSGRVERIVANAEAGAADMAAKGVRREKLMVIHNGIDCARFRPDPESGRRFRLQWGVPETAPLIGVVARLDPMKGHEVVLEALALALKRNPDLHVVLIGSGAARYSTRLKAQSDKRGIGTRVVWAGAEQDVAGALNALDLHCSASLFGEGFSNAIAEAMAAAVPSVVTGIGDSALLVGDCGFVVDPGDAQALADAWLAYFERDSAARRALGERCRARIEADFALPVMVRKTAALYGELAGVPAMARDDCHVPESAL